LDAQKEVYRWTWRKIFTRAIDAACCQCDPVPAGKPIRDNALTSFDLLPLRLTHFSKMNIKLAPA
jgi:hypothetical protein